MGLGGKALEPEGDMAEKASMASRGSSGASGGKQEELRGNWSGQLDFIMSCVSYAVGLGNIWRFPYLCYRNGGAVFLIPYLIFMFMCGMPLFFMEVSYGQFASLSPITVWHLSPLFKGVGYGMVMISGIVCVYYNIIIAWTLYFLFHSFYPVLPWSTCDNWWNTERCVLSKPSNDTLTNDTLANWTATTPATTVTTLTTALLNATTEALNATKLKWTSPSEEFWERNVLQISEGIENMGGIRWELFGCLLLAWALVFLCLIKGVKSSGKVMYFTATFPYIVLLCLLVRAVTLDGAMDGVMYYMVPKDWHKLLTLRIWGEAAMQIFYSVGAAWGALITMASFNKFDNNCYRDARILPILNCGTSIFAGFVIFSIIGFMAKETGSTIEETVTHGPGLVFVVYPEAVSRFPVPQMWAIMFFAMLLSIGIGSQVGMFQTMTNAFIDEFDFLKTKKVLLTAALCLAELLLGLPCITKGGIYFLQIMDWYSSTFSLMIISFTECMVISWVYGVERFYKDIELMLGFRPCLWWKILWSFVTPALILFVFTFSILIHSPVTYGEHYSYPGWAIGIGWVMALCSLIPFPVIFVRRMLEVDGSFVQRFRQTSIPSAEWGPSLDEDRERWLATLTPHDRHTMRNVLQARSTSQPLKPLEAFTDV